MEEIKQKEQEKRKPFCLNFGQGKFENQYDLSESEQLYKKANKEYTMKLFTAQNKTTKEICAVKKVTSLKSDFIENIWKELNSIISIKDHKCENMINYYEAFLYDKPWKNNKKEGDQVAIIVMELGEYTLNDIIEEGLEEKEYEKEALEKLKQTLLGLKFLRDNHIYHRDIKPANLVVKNNIVKLIDLDVSKNSPYSKTQKITEKVGTHLYMDPQLKVLQEDVEEECYYSNIEKSDLFSLGLTFLQFCRRMKLDEYKKFKIKIDNCVIMNKRGEYKKLLFEQIDQIQDEKLKKIMEKVLCYRVQDRWGLDECLEEAFKLEIDIRDMEDYQNFKEKYGMRDVAVQDKVKKVKLFIQDDYLEYFQETLYIIEQKFQKGTRINISLINYSYDLQIEQIKILVDNFKQSRKKIQLYLSICSFQNADSIRKIAVLLKQLSCICFLKLHFQYNGQNKYSEEEYSLVGLKEFSFIHSLSINYQLGKQHQKEQIDLLSSVLLYHKSISCLSIEFQIEGQSEYFTKKIMETIQQLSCLRKFELHLYKLQLSDFQIVMISKAILKNSSLTSLKLDFDYEYLEETGVKIIADCLSQIPYLKALELDLFNISDSELAIIGKSIQQTRFLDYLRISISMDNSIKQCGEGINILFDNIKDSLTLRSLIVFIGYENGKEIDKNILSESLKTLSSLHTLKMDFRIEELNRRDNGLGKLLEALKGVQSLKNLEIRSSHMNFEEQQDFYIDEGLFHLIQIQQLKVDLSYNNIGDYGAGKILDSLYNLPYLSCLDYYLLGNKIEDKN